MLKKNLSIITLLVILILALTFPVVMADDEDVDNNAKSEEVVETVPEQDLYETSVTSSSVTINSQIGGDAFILAKSVDIGQEAYIFSNLFVAAENVNIKGVVYDLYSASKSLNISGYVYRDIKVSTNSLNILGTIGRNAFVNCKKINFINENNISGENEEAVSTSTGRIGGNLEYSSENELSIPEENINGNIHFNKISNNSEEKSLETYIMSLATFVTTVVLIWLIGLIFHIN